jgi:hypothetical protein
MNARITTVSLGLRPGYFSLVKLIAKQFRFSLEGAIAPKHNASGRISSRRTAITAIADDAYSIDPNPSANSRSTPLSNPLAI